MFVRRIRLKFKAGNGGNGAISFRREKYVPFGGPDGGDGGKGGNVVIRTERKLDSLGHIKNMKALKAQDGQPGKGGKRHGHNGADLVIKVPVGTSVQKGGGAKVTLDREGDQIVVGLGGRGGWGNARFATAENRAPRIAQKGQEGEEGEVLLELSLPADIAIIGMPNTGKSSLLNWLTGARAKVAEYPFTTKEVVRGVYNKGDRPYIIMELPAIIEHSHQGKGLGLEFLRHLEKAKVIVHLVDGTAEDIMGNVDKVNKEIFLFKPEIMKKHQLLAINKMDRPEVREHVQSIKNQLVGRMGKCYVISALTGEGVEDLIDEAIKLIELQTEDVGNRDSLILLTPKEKSRNSVYRKNDVFVIEAPALQDMIERTDMASRDAQAYMRQQFARAGILKLLKREGVKPGERVRCGKVEWDWQWPL